MLGGEELACGLGPDPRPCLGGNRSVASGLLDLGDAAGDLDPLRADVVAVDGVWLAQPPRTTAFPGVAAATCSVHADIVLGFEIVGEWVQSEAE